MLLLLRGAAPIAPAANFGIVFGLSAIPGVTANFDIHMDLVPPTAVEVLLTAKFDIKFGLLAIPIGYVSRSANLDTHLGLNAIGGFGERANLGIKFGMTATVGTSFNGQANFDTVFGLTASPTVVTGIAPLDIKFGLSGAPSISGGTLTPTTNLEINLDMAASPRFVDRANLDITMNLNGTAVIAAPPPVTIASMALSFESDTLRLFFRKK